VKTIYIDNCGDCPHIVIDETYDIERCKRMNNKYIDIEFEVAIPPWCPLPDI
jgi:hypothetical protein